MGKKLCHAVAVRSVDEESLDDRSPTGRGGEPVAVTSACHKSITASGLR
jgi:hypothetical protein